MMKLRNFMAVACMATATLGISGCSEDDIQGQEAQKAGTIVATVDKNETRTSVGTSNNILWSKGDAFGVYYTKKSKSENKFYEYKLESGEGTASGTFSLNGSPDSDGYTIGSHAVHPYQEAMTLSGTTLSMSMNGTNPLTYTADSNGPMYATVSTDATNNITFNHLAALLKVTLNKMPATATKFKVTASNVIAGSFTADLSKDKPELIAATNNTEEKNKSVTVTFTAVTNEGSQTFYLPLPTGTYASLNISLLDDTNKTLYSMTWSSTTVARAEILTANLDVVTIDATTPSDIKSALEEAIKAPTSGETQTANIALTGEINTSSASGEADRTIEVPVIEKSDANLAFTNLTTSANAPLVLKSSESSSEAPNTAINRISVAVPETASAAEAPSVTITMPKTTVTLAPAGATATYNKVIAKTATNTIVVAAGVTVKELVIAGGNVEIYGTVEKLSKDDSNKAESITVTSGGAANIKVVENTDSKFKISSTWDGTSKVAPTDNKIYTAAQLAHYQSTSIPVSSAGKDLTATMTVATTLCADIDLNDKPWIGMVLGEGIAFDGGNHTISKVLVTEHVLSENGIYTPAACVGLFAATKPSSTIKDITVDGFTAKDAGANAKWNGALVGYSYGTSSYNNCHAKNVKIESENADAYRIGGLIGFIGSVSGTDVEVTLANCSATDVTIKGSFCIGGLVGSLQGGTRNFNTCTVSNAKLSINKNSSALKGAWSGNTFYAPYKWWAGYMSMFIGEANCNTINIDSNCSIANNAKFTAEELKSFGYDDIAEYEYTKNATPEEIASAKSKANHYQLQDGNSFLPACVDKGTIKVGSTTLVPGTDYNKFTLTKAGNGSAEGYDKTDGSWAN